MLNFRAVFVSALSVSVTFVSWPDTVKNRLSPVRVSTWSFRSSVTERLTVTSVVMVMSAVSRTASFALSARAAVSSASVAACPTVSWANTTLGSRLSARHRASRMLSTRFFMFFPPFPPVTA